MIQRIKFNWKARAAIMSTAAQKMASNDTTSLLTPIFSFHFNFFNSLPFYFYYFTALSGERERKHDFGRRVVGSSYSRIEDHFERRMTKMPEQGVTDCRFNVRNVTTVWNVVSVFRNLSFNWGQEAPWETRFFILFGK